MATRIHYKNIPLYLTHAKTRDFIEDFINKVVYCWVNWNPQNKIFTLIELGPMPHENLINLQLYLNSINNSKLMPADELPKDPQTHILLEYDIDFEVWRIGRHPDTNQIIYRVLEKIR